MKHYLTPNHGTQMPWHVVALDTETASISKPGADKQTHQLVLGCMVYRRYWIDRQGDTQSRVTTYRFDTVEEFINHLRPIVMRSKRRTFLYAHNSNFDFAIINLEHVFNVLELETECYINERPPVIVIGKRNTSTLICLDSLNLFPFSLEKLANAMGFGGKDNMPDVSDREALYAYCARDTQLLSQILDAWRTFILQHDLGNYRLTLASQSMSAYRHRYMPPKTLVQTSQEWILKTERDTYKGGRTEAFVIGRVEGDIYMLDVNSMYPYVMGMFRYPVRFRVYRKNVSPLTYPLPDGVEMGMAHITCTLKAPMLPVHIQGRLCFPVGLMEGVWTWQEISHALPYMTDIIWHEFWAYEFKPLFSVWAQDLYQLRLKYEDSDRPAFALSVKLLLNSLYGKFGQMTPQWVDIGPARRPEGDSWYHQENQGEPLQRCRVRMGIEQRTTHRTETPHSLPLLASTVTAHARSYLWQLMCLAGLPHVLYTDTDSLMVTQEGYDRLQHMIEPRVLGALGLEWHSEWVEIHGAKDYAYEGGTKRKGVKRNAQKLGRDIFRMDQFRSWDYMVSQGKFGQIDIQTVTKHLHRTYHKGVVGADGVVSPFVLGEDDMGIL